jgi:hypothetical protein
MRKSIILTLAFVLAAASTSAFAGGYHDRGWRDHRHDHRWDRRDRPHRDAYLVGGLLLGLAAGAALSDDDRGWRRGGYDYDYDYDSRYDRGYYGGGYYDNRPYYGGREVIVYRERPRWGGRRYYAPPRRVVYEYGGYRRW